jgi:1-acyl-sn-glycerol-3-phosphate acyltransferase
MRERLGQGDILVLFPEGTSSDGRAIKPFKSAFFGAAELPGVIVQPLTLAYSGHRNLPMNGRLRPFYAWYGDMDLPPHLWQALAMGPIEVTVIFHSPLRISEEHSRKALARHAEREVRQGLLEATR